MGKYEYITSQNLFITNFLQVLVYAKASTCDKKYCEESCLDPVEEQCSSTVYKYPNCDVPIGMF